MANRFKENKDFISQIRDHPALWDQTHHLHADKIVCDALWETIGNNFNINGPGAKSRWKNLRDNFRRELRRSSLGLRGNTAEEYNSSWRYFEHMFFVKEQLRQNNIISPLVMSKTQNRLDAKQDSSTSILPNGEIDEVEIVETTHDAFVREFPKASYSKVPKPGEGVDLQRQMAEAMLASIDPDVGFLASLLPHLRSVHSGKKALLKNHLLQVVLQYSDNDDIAETEMVCDELHPRAGSEEVEAPNEENRNKLVPVQIFKRKSLLVQDSSAKKLIIDDSFSEE